MLKKISLIGLILTTVIGISHAQSCHSSSKSSADKKTAIEKPNIQKKVQTKCPVMGNNVVSSISYILKSDKGNESKKVYFCCPPCIETFKKNPDKYIKKLEKMKQPIETVATVNDVWICTMCPDIKSEKSGNCPKCGMALTKKG